MKLSKVIIENYRGYYGKNIIEFDVNSKGKNISLVIARNDTGKTTFLNAIYWCLYGDEQLYSIRNSDKRLMSHKKIAETPIDGKMKMMVSLIFSDEKGPKWEISRERIFKKVRDDENDLRIIPQGEDKFYGMKMNSSNTGYEEIEYINDFVASEIPPGISSFFLLDGEQLKAIFTSEINYKIKESIERVANMGSISGMISSLTDLDRKYAGMKSGMDANFGAYQKQIDDCDTRMDDHKNNLQKTMKETEVLKKQLGELVDFLGNHNESYIRERGAREKRIREENETLNEYRKADESELNNLIIQSYILKNSENSLRITVDKFDSIISSGNFPPAVDPAHVLQLLKRKECICGRDIKRDSEEEKRLKTLANAQSYKEYVRIISEGDSRIPEMLGVIDSNMKKITELKKKITSNEKKIEKNVKELEEISQSLKDCDIEEIKEKAEEKEMIERAIFRNEKEIGNYEKDLKDLDEVKKSLERDLTNIKIKSEKDRIIIKKSEKCKELINYAKKIKEEIMKRIKDKIEESTANNFRELHWKAEDYEKVKISDNFSLSIKDKYKGEITNELSQGAALCFGLAFMTALRNYSGYDVPIIIDSPVGKIDEGNREKIATNLPNQLKDKQVIFLVTNSEYSSVFKEHLDDKIATKIILSYNKKTGGIDIENGCN
jgi:DNA sulfur modification protein DndD